MSRKFRFASLLQWRERQRDEAGAAVGQALEAIARIEQQRQEILQAQVDARASATTARIGVIAVDRLIADGRFAVQLELELRGLDETRQQLLEALDQRQQRLVLAEAEVKRFERLRELDREAEHREQQRRDQLSLDEAVTNRYLMQRREAQRLRD